MKLLDISGAFDSIKWSHIIKNLKKAQMSSEIIKAAKELLSEREVRYESSIGLLKRTSQIGCPQGGKASPTLWNIGMNDLLINLNSLNIFNLAYADDLIMIIESNYEITVEISIIEALRAIDKWCASTGLSLSTQKSQIVNIGRLNYERKVEINGDQIEYSPYFKYLSITLSRELKFKEYLNELEKKTIKLTNTINFIKFMNKNLKIKDLKILYDQLALPIVNYGYQIWFKEFKFKYQFESLRRIQRKILLSLSKAYYI